MAGRTDAEVKEIYQNALTMAICGPGCAEPFKDVDFSALSAAERKQHIAVLQAIMKEAMMIPASENDGPALGILGQWLKNLENGQAP